MVVVLDVQLKNTRADAWIVPTHDLKFRRTIIKCTGKNISIAVRAFLWPDISLGDGGVGDGRREAGERAGADHHDYGATQSFVHDILLRAGISADILGPVP